MGEPYTEEERAELQAVLDEIDATPGPSERHGDALVRREGSELRPLAHALWKAGIFYDVPVEEYHQRELGVVSKSALDRLAKSPAHYRAWVDGIEKGATTAQKFGTAWHMKVLEPERFKSLYVVQPDFGDCRYKENKANRDAWLKEHAGFRFLDPNEMRAIEDMFISVMRHPAASRLVVEGAQEVTVRWVDQATGLRCKSRADYYVPQRRIVVDLKSTLDASEDKFKRTVYDRRYHAQDALYRAGFAECGEPIEYFALLCVEKEPPYAVAVYVLDEDAVAKGFNAARRDITRLAECLETDHWPSYSDGVRQLSLPPWAA